MSQDVLDNEKKKLPWFISFSRVGAPNDYWLIGYLIASLALIPLGFLITPLVKGMVLSGAALLSAVCYFAALIWLRRNGQFNQR